jgi:PAS domain S-box-containing protein
LISYRGGEGKKVMRDNNLIFFQEISQDDHPGRFIDINDNACLELGYSKEEFLKLSPCDIVPPEKRHVFLSILESLKKHNHFKFDMDFVARDGRLFPIVLQAFLLHLKNDRGILYLSLPDGSLSLANEAMRDGEEKYRLLVENMDEGVVISQRDEFIFFNRRFAEILGYHPEELHEKDFNDIYTPRGIEILSQRSELRDKGEDVPSRYETFFRKKDGAEIDVEANVAIIDYKGECATFAVIRDISSRKQVEEDLRRAHEIYCKAIENAQGVPYRFKYSDENYEFIGEGCEALLGIPSDELRVSDIWDIVKETVITDPEAPRDPVEYLKAFQRGERKRYKTDIRIVTRTGEEKWLSDFAVPILDDKTGKVIGSLGILLDISERKQAEKVLKDYAQHLEEMVEERTRELKEIQEQLVRKEKLALLGQLAGGVGHELRNPLSVINNALYYLKIIMPDADEKVTEYLELIESEVQSAEKIISDLMDFSRTKPVEREEISISELMRPVLDKLPPPENILVSTDFPPDLPRVFVDPRQIGQILNNLVLNAYQAMLDGGHLYINAVHEQNEIFLTIKDTGCGISEDHMKKIFEPLFTTKKGGIGLGLSITKNLVEANGGKIEISSKDGQGSAFTVVLPVRE